MLCPSSQPYHRAVPDSVGQRVPEFLRDHYVFRTVDGEGGTYYPVGGILRGISVHGGNLPHKSVQGIGQIGIVRGFSVDEIAFRVSHGPHRDSEVFHGHPRLTASSIPFIRYEERSGLLRYEETSASVYTFWDGSPRVPAQSANPWTNRVRGPLPEKVYREVRKRPPPCRLW